MKRPSVLRRWRYVLMTTAAYHAPYAPWLVQPFTLRGGEWGDIVFAGERGLA